MSYGSKQGVQDMLLGKYQLFESAGKIDDATLARIQIVIDAEIDAEIAAVVAVPLVTVPQKIKNIADMLTCYFILRGSYTSVDPNESKWVDRFKKDAQENIKTVMANPAATFGAASTESSANIAQSSTLGQDRIFTVTKTQAGEETLDENGNDEGTTEGW